MEFTILTLFPDVINKYLDSSIIKRAIEKNKIKVNVINFRDFSKNKHKKVDGYSIGGGPGMVLQLQPIVDCLKSLDLDAHKILLTPSGKIYNQQHAKQLLKFRHIILICGHYEGFDERIINYIDEEISVGNYVLTGGEIPSLLILDSITRLVPGVINKNSLEDESYNDYLLDYPVYTKPIEFEGNKVPEVLLSGNHSLINKYRYNERIRKTKEKNQYLFKKFLKIKKGDKNEKN